MELEKLQKRIQLLESNESTQYKQLTTKISNLTNNISDLALSFSKLEMNLFGTTSVSDAARSMNRELFLLSKYDAARTAISKQIHSIPKLPPVTMYDMDTIVNYYDAFTEPSKSRYFPQSRVFGIHLGDILSGKDPLTYNSIFNLSGSDSFLIHEYLKSIGLSDSKRDSYTLEINAKRVESADQLFSLSVSFSEFVILSQTLKLSSNELRILELSLHHVPVSQTITAAESQQPDFLLPSQNVVTKVALSRFCLRYLELNPNDVLNGAYRLANQIDFSTVNHFNYNPLSIFKPVENGDLQVLPYIFISERAICEGEPFSSLDTEFFTDIINDVLAITSDLKGCAGNLLVLECLIGSLFDNPQKNADEESVSEENLLGMMSYSISENAKAVASIIEKAVMVEESTVSLNLNSKFCYSVPPSIPTLSFADSWNPGRTWGNSSNGIYMVLKANEVKGWGGKNISLDFEYEFKNIKEGTNMHDYVRVQDNDETMILLHIVRQPPKVPLPKNSGQKNWTLDTRHPSVYVDKSSFSVESEYAPGYSVIIKRERTYAPQMYVDIKSENAFTTVSFSLLVLMKKALGKVDVSSSHDNNFVELDIYGVGAQSVLRFDSWKSIEYTTPLGEKYYGVISETDSFFPVDLGGRFYFWFDGAESAPTTSVCNCSLAVGIVPSPSGSVVYEYTKSGRTTSSTEQELFQGSTYSLDYYSEHTAVDGASPTMNRLDFKLRVNSDTASRSVETWLSKVEPSFPIKVPPEEWENDLERTTISRKSSDIRTCFYDSIAGKIVRGSLVLSVPMSNKLSGDIYEINPQLDDFENELASTKTVALRADAVSLANSYRLDQIDAKLKEMDDAAMIEFGLTMVSMFLPALGPVTVTMFKSLNKITSRMVGLSAQLLGSAMKKSSKAGLFLKMRRGLYDISSVQRNIGKASIEAGLIRKKLRRVPEYSKIEGDDASDLFLRDLNHVVFDPIEYQAYNIHYAYTYRKPPDGKVWSDILSHEMNYKTDVSGAVLTVYHRPLQCLPSPVREKLFKLATKGLDSGTIKGREKWLGTTIHPTHSYVSISYDYPDIKKNRILHNLTFTGIGDANPLGIVGSDLKAGIGTYHLVYELTGLNSITGARVMKLLPYSEAGYTSDDVYNIFKTMIGKEPPVNTTAERCWYSIAFHSRRRLHADKPIASTPISLDREMRLRQMLHMKDWKYNLLTKNCQDYAHSLYEYAKGGEVPTWMSETLQIEAFNHVAHTIDEMTTWPIGNTGLAHRVL